MIPKAGDIVYLNHDFLKVWFRRGNEYFGEEVWREKYTVTEVKKFFEHELKVKFESRNIKYRLYISSNGEFDFHGYREIQVFIPANISEINNNIYCSCNGPKKENSVFRKKVLYLYFLQERKSLV